MTRTHKLIKIPVIVLIIGLFISLGCKDNPGMRSGVLKQAQPIELFKTEDHEMTGKLWINDSCYQELRVLPLSVDRALHSHWGDMCWAGDGRLYLPPATHSDLDASIWLIRYDPKKAVMEMVFDARRQLSKGIGSEGLWDSKIHSDILEGRDGKLYFAGMIGGSYATMYTHMVHPSGYLGGHIYEYNIQTGITTDLGIGYRGTSLVASDIDVERNTIYFLSLPQLQFLVFPLDTKEMRNLGTVNYHPVGPEGERLQWGRDLFVYEDHTVWTSNNYGCFVYYDPDRDELIDTRIALPKNEALRVHVTGCGPTAGKVYGMTSGGWLFEFDPVKGSIVEFGSVIEQGPFYSPNLAITPDGRSLYYIAGTHGDEAAGGIHIMRYDILERERVDLGRIGREVIPAFYSYGAKVNRNKVYFTVHGGDPSNTYLVIYDPENKKHSLNNTMKKQEDQL